MSKAKPYQRNLPVPFFSQRENQYMWEIYKKGNLSGEKKSVAWCSCNVTSLCMIMRYFGLSEDTPDDMMAKIHNYAAETIGSKDPLGIKIRNENESFLTVGENLERVLRKIYNVPEQYKIVRTWKTKKLEGLYDEIAAGYPVWISYGPTWKASYTEAERGKGHIAVVRGFTENNDVIINDPWGDAADPYGFLTGGGDELREGVYYAGAEDFYYSFASGDNCILREKEIKRILVNNGAPVFNQTLVIRYPHYWSFPVRGAGGKILRFDRELEEDNPPADKLEERLNNKMNEMLSDESLLDAGFPIAELGTYHDGIHIESKNREEKKVYAIGPGRLAAARITEARKTNGSRTSACFALVQHSAAFKVKGETEAYDFYSYYMHLKPINDMNAPVNVSVENALSDRIKARLNASGNPSARKNDWLDQAIDHILPKRARVQFKKKPDIYDIGGKNKGNLDSEMLIVLSPVDSGLKRLVERVCANEALGLAYLYNNINDGLKYETDITINGKRKTCYAFYYSDSEGKACIRYIIKEDAPITMQSVNIWEYAYYRKRLSTLAAGEAAVFLGEDKDADDYRPLVRKIAKSREQVFNECVKKEFEEETKKENGLKLKSKGYDILNDIANYYGNTKNNKTAGELFEHYNKLIRALVRYPREEINKPFSLTNGGRKWFDKIIKSFKSAFGGGDLAEGLEENAYFVHPSNIDYHIEVSEGTIIGAMGNFDPYYEGIPDQRLVHFSLFSADNIAQKLKLLIDTFPQPDQNNPKYVMGISSQKGPYVDCHAFVKQLNSIRFFTKELKYPDKIPEKKRQENYENNPNKFYLIVRHPNSFQAVDERQIEKRRSGATGYLESKHKDAADLETYAGSTWLNKEIEGEFNKHRISINDNVFSYHPVGFLRLLFKYAT